MRVTGGPVALDLFGCQGAFASGLATGLAGWEVWSVERERLHARRNPFSWYVGDWRDGLERALMTGRVAYVHASPPCQGYSATRCLADAQGRGRGRAVDLIPEVREALAATGLPFTIENVERSPLVGAKLCGSMFGLAVQRHRVFEANFIIPQPRCDHSTFPLDPVTGRPRPWGVYGSLNDAIPSGGRTALDKGHAAALLGVTHPMTVQGLKEALPPVYGHHVARAVLAARAGGGTFEQLSLLAG